MKLTPYKIARIKSYLPEEDKEEIDKQINKGKLDDKMMSNLAKNAFMLLPKRLSKTKGAFGKKGTNRKEQKMQEKVEAFKRAIDEQKKIEELKKPSGETVKKSE